MVSIKVFWENNEESTDVVKTYLLITILHLISGELSGSCTKTIEKRLSIKKKSKDNVPAYFSLHLLMYPLGYYASGHETLPVPFPVNVYNFIHFFNSISLELNKQHKMHRVHHEQIINYRAIHFV